MYTLARKIGGRSEVINAPVVDMFGYLIADFEEKEREADREAQRIFIEHMSRLNSNQAQSKDEQRQQQKFIKQITPQNRLTEQPERRSIGNNLEWDSFDKIKALENR